MNFGSNIRRLLRNLRWPRRPSEGWNSSLGARGEHAAARYLRRHRFRVLARNFRCGVGELDIVAVGGDTIVFVEVKTRSGSEPVDPAQVISPTKQRRLARAARYFLQQRSIANWPCRFDLITIAWPSRGKPLIEHFEDAFQPGYS